MIVLCRIWSKLSQYESEYIPLQENHGKGYIFSLSFRKGRQLIRPSLLVLLLWCLAVTALIVRQGALSVPRYENFGIGKGILAHLFAGWERPKNVGQNGNYSGSISSGGTSDNDNKGGYHVNVLDALRIGSANDTLLSWKRKPSSEEANNRRYSVSFQSAFSFVRGILWRRERRVEKEDYFACDRTHWRTDVCHLRGDVVVRDKLITLRSRSKPKKIHETETIKPYPRKWEVGLMKDIEPVTIKHVYKPFSFWGRSAEQKCDAKYSVPAVVFSTGGYSGHLYHDFNDCLLPLFITIQHLKGEVVLLNLHYRHWWLHRYRNIVEQLTHYPVIDIDNDNRTFCFPEVLVGVKIHDDLIVNSTLMPSGESIQHFRQILAQAFKRGNEEMPVSEALQRSTTKQAVPGSPLKAKAPKLVLISRKESRVLTNEDEVVNLAERLGFQVEVVVPRGEIELSSMFEILQSCDVMMGVHGAALTHFLFMRPGSVFIQVVPLGTEWPSSSFFGEPAVRSGLHYIRYKIKFEESSLNQKYNSSDPVITDPKTVISKGWIELRNTYLQDQNMTLSIPRMKKVFLKALAKVSGNG